MNWDFETQKAETEAVVRSLLGKGDVYEGKPIVLEVQTIDAGGGDKVTYVETAEKEGFTWRGYDGDGETCEVEIIFDDAHFDVESIWRREKAATELALKFGFQPDGWGFFSGRTRQA